MAEALQKIEWLSLPGLTPYAEAHKLMLELVEKRVKDEIPDTVIALEHTPVVTRGRGLQLRASLKGEGSSDPQIRQMPLAPLPKGIDYFEIERGGDLTYHGPGQLVLYPIIKITDLERYLRGMETWVISFLSSYGIKGQSVPGSSGVWVGDKKIASLGVAVRRWVTFHGVAINIVNDLSPFSLISPCGFQPEVMTNLIKCMAMASVESGESDFEGNWRSFCERKFKDSVKSLNLILS